ncbi:hypothetical protein BH11CYA1_BH11CYA1_40890 [soil metagenome]
MNSIVPDTWKIPTQLIARFGDSAGKQRAMFAEGHLLLVLHNPPSPSERERQAKLLWRAANGAWACNTDGSETDLLKKHLACYSVQVDQLESLVQTASCADDYFYLLQAIAPLHRSSRNLHTTLQQARELLAEDRDLIVARDSAGEIERAFELLHLDAKNGLDYTVAKKSELQSQQSYEMAISAHRLNVLAAIFFPITALSSIFAINPAMAPATLLGSAGFWTVLGVGALTGLLLSQGVARKPPAINDSPPVVPKTNFRYGSGLPNNQNRANKQTTALPRVPKRSYKKASAPQA